MPLGLRVETHPSPQQLQALWAALERTVMETAKPLFLKSPWPFEVSGWNTLCRKMQLWDPQTLTLHYNKWTHRATTGFLLSGRSFCSNSHQVSEKTLMTRGPWHSSQATEQGRGSPSLLHVTHPRLGGAGQLVKQLIPLTTDLRTWMNNRCSTISSRPWRKVQMGENHFP